MAILCYRLTLNLLMLKNNSIFKQALLLLVAAASTALPAQTTLSNTPPASPIRIAMIEGMSGAFANAGEAVLRNIRFAVERVNAAGGIKLATGPRALELIVLDNKGQPDETLLQLKTATEKGVLAIMQGNSSSVAAVLVDAVEKHNAREPNQRALFLNYSAADPALTNEKCSFWHFRFDAHIDMRMAALVSQIAQDKSIKSLYLLNQDYAFGQQVAKSARSMVAAVRPDIVITGDELHPLGRIKDFAPYANKIKASGADAVLTGNWGNDLTLFVKAAKDVSLDATFYTFYGNSLGAAGTLAEAGVDRVLAVSEWHNNASAGGATSELDALYAAFRKRYPEAKDDYFNARNVLMIQMLVKAIEQAGTADAALVAKQLENMRADQGAGHIATMRGADHQLIQPLYVSRMGKQGQPGVVLDVEGSGYGFKTALRVPAAALTQAHRCVMQRP